MPFKDQTAQTDCVIAVCPKCRWIVKISPLKNMDEAMQTDFFKCLQAGYHLERMTAGEFVLNPNFGPCHCGHCQGN